MKVAYIVAPDGASGGGMGRVKDYICEAPAGSWGDIEPRALITRDAKGFGSGRWRSVQLLWRCLSAIRRGRRDGTLALVHVNMGDRLSALRKSLVVWQCHWLGVPVYIHLHAVELDKLPRAVLPLLAATFRRATAVIVLGAIYQRWVHDTLGVTSVPTEILWNAVPIAPVATRRHDPPADAGRARHVVFLGSLGRRKGTPELLAALATLADDPHWRATLAGPGDLDHYRAEAARLGLADRIAFPGWQDQAGVRALLADADVMVLPSWEEGLPLVILEAMALGTPVIATPVGAIPEVLRDGEEMIAVQPGDVPGLAAALAWVCGDPALRQHLCDRGLERFRALFAMEVYIANLGAIWRRYLPQR